MPRRLVIPDPRRLVATVAAAVAVIAALDACAARPRPVAAAPTAEASPAGALFSTIPCAGTSLGREWSRLRGEAEARFPGLVMTRVEDLHITIVYIGEGWRVDDLERIRAHSLVGPREPASFRPEVVRFGRNNQVVVVELHGAPESWLASIVAEKDTLNRLGLKRPESYDAAFRPHVTLASARRSPPDSADASALGEFRSWLAQHVVADEGRFAVTVDPDTPIRLWLAGTARPPGAAAFVDLADYLARP
jgi:2'-5' RNA ligase